ncbi:AMP-binding protein [Pseudomonas baltica]|uniref:AMP-binding protein n=1 Tax=Pseudomonas baltica TaxID=2762576 RepID=UPI0028985240|nr:AMP-binding protein [Pseudomonas baltica]
MTCAPAASSRSNGHNWTCPAGCLTVNGAEPVNKQTLDAFQEAFGPVGFRASAFSPSYGMAETTLLVASTPAHLPFRHLVADRRQLAQGRLVAGGSETIDVVSSGVVDRDASLCVVDPETLQPLADGFVGELWVAGPMVADGYWNNAEATRETFFVTLDGGEHHWLRTGDLGAIVDHQVYVTGRIKDLIIVAGHNHYPSDIESTVVASHSAVRANGVAAFAIDRHGEEALALVVELERGWSELDLNAVRDTLIAQVSRHHQLRVEQLTFVAINQVAKTSSGKIQRGRTREQLLRGELRPLSMETAQ